MAGPMTGRLARPGSLTTERHLTTTAEVEGRRGLLAAARADGVTTVALGRAALIVGLRMTGDGRVDLTGARRTTAAHGRAASIGARQTMTLGMKAAAVRCVAG